MTRLIHQPDPRLDLVLERIVDVPQELVWAVWTTPEHLKHWFTPVPWKTVDCEIDLRPGGIFRTVMRSPEGKEFPNVGCYLEIVKNEKLVWTNALTPGYRPSNPSAAEVAVCGSFLFTAVILLNAIRKGPSTPHSSSTRTKRLENSMRKWDSTKAGARPSISLLRI
jgi:uncharacterized protein YndB with AHSA1/START domain